MKIRVECPAEKCRQSYQVEARQLGRQVRCKSCGHEFTLEASTSDTLPQTAAASRDTVLPAADPPALPVHQPKRVDRFEIRGRLGGGAFGDVYRAFDTRLEREVALKLLRPGLSDNEHVRARFVREAKLAGQLQHPHIVTVFDAGEVDGQCFIASALITGRVLSDWQHNQQVDPRIAARLVAELGDALQYAHEQGIVHRDVKPGNIIVATDGVPRLMDFGLARDVELADDLTRDGSLLGTPGYMAPEQAHPSLGSTGPASDQYSLGVVLYELLCGQKPFQGPPEVLLYHLLHRDPMPPSKVRAGIARDVETVCLKAMAKVPEQRYRSCGELAADLRRWLAHEPIQARRPAAWERAYRWCQRRPGIAAALLVACLLALGSSAALYAYRSTARALSREQSQREAMQSQLTAARSESERTHGELARAQDALAQAEQRLLATETALQQALAALGQAEQARQQATTDAERAAADRQIAEAEALVARAERERAQAVWAHVMAVKRVAPERPRPKPLPLLPEPPPPLIAPLSTAALVSRPAELPGNPAWTLETRMHRGRLTSAAFHPQGNLLATAGFDGTIRLWHYPSGRLHSLLLGHDHMVHDVAWSPDGNLLASAAEDTTVRVWDWSRGRQIAVSESFQEPVTRVAWSPQRTLLLAAGYSGRLRTWEPTNPEASLRTFPKPYGSIPATLTWHPDGEQFAYGSGATGRMVLVEASSGDTLQSLPGRLGKWLPDGKSFVAGGGPDGLLLYDTTTWEARRLAPEVTSAVAVDASPDGTTIVWSGEGVHLMSLVTGEQWSVAKYPHRLAWMHDGRSLVLVHPGWAKLDLSFLDLATREVRDVPPGHLDAVTAVAWSNEGSLVASAWVGAQGYHIEIWDTRLLRPVLNLAVDEKLRRKGFVTSLAWSPNDEWLAASLRDVQVNQLVVWQLGPAAPYQLLEGHKGYAQEIAWSSDGRLLASAGHDGHVGIWDLVKGKLVGATQNLGGPVLGVAWSPRDPLLAVAAAKQIHLFERKALIHRQEGVRDHGGVAWSPDGERFVAEEGWGHLQFFKPDGSRTEDHIQLGRGVSRLAWSPADQLLAVSVADPREILVTDLASSSVVRRFRPAQHGTRVMAWSPDGRQLAVSSPDSSLRVYDVAAGHPTGTITRLQQDRWLVVSANGHCWLPHGGQEELLYVVATDAGQRWLTPQEFADKYAWKNDSEQARRSLLSEPSDPSR